MIQWFRAPTSRPNIRYQVVRKNGGDDDEVKAIVEQLFQQYPAGKFIIYSTRVARVRALATALD